MQEEKIKPPELSKGIITFLLNFVLFIVYYYIVSFLVGVVAGITLEIIGLDTENFNYSYLVLPTIAITVILSVIFRKRVFFKVSKKEQIN